MANNIVLNPQKGDAIVLTGVSSAYNQPNAFASIGVTVYTTASIAANANSALYGKTLTVAGFTGVNVGNNGTFFVLASTATTITMNNANGVVVSAAATASYLTQGAPAGYASKVENQWSNQNGENATVNANTGDLLVAIAIGMKSYQPFDLLHGSSPAFGYLQGLNDFNANPTIDDTSTGGATATVTGVAIAKTSLVLTGVNTIATITATSAASTAATITNIAINASNVLTVTATNTFKVGENVLLAGLTTATFLNGQTVTVLTSPGATFTATFVHATYVSAADTGTATGNLLTITAANSITAGQSVYVSGTEEAVLNGQVFVALTPLSGTQIFANYTGAPFTNAADTGTAAQISTNGSAVYAGTITGGGSNALAGYYFTTAGFAHSQNNGTFLCTASTVSSLTLSNAQGFGEVVVGASATDFILTLTASNSFTAGQTVQLASFVNAPFLNGQLAKIVVQTGSAITANYPQFNEAYTGTETAATATIPGGNTWALAAHLNIADSDPTTPSYTTSSQWNLDQYYPSIYIWVAQNAVAGNYKVNLNSMYQLGIDDPTDYAAGSIPIFDGGVNFQVFNISGALTTGQPQAFSISTGTPAETTANPATAPGTLTLSGGDGGALLSIGLMKSGNVFAAGSVGGTPLSLTLTAVAPLQYGPAQFAAQNYGGSVYTGTITNGANNGLVGNQFTVAGFVNSVNNSPTNTTFVCTASTATTLTLNNGVSVAETHAGTATYTPLMLQIGQGRLVGSEAHYIVEFQTVAAGTYNPGFNNPLGYALLVGSIAIQST